MLRLIVLSLAVGIVLLFANNWNVWSSSAVNQTSDDAYLQADITPLATKVSGYVRQVAVNDFQKVKARALLIQIEDNDYRAEVAQAEANVQAAEEAIAYIDNQKILQQTLIRQAAATVAATEWDVWFFRRESDRQQALLARRTISPETAEQSMGTYKHGAATLDLNRAQLEQQRQQLKLFEQQELQAQATLRAQQSALDLAQINLGYTKIVAPVDGMVGQRQVQPGQYVSVGTQVISIVPLPHLWVIANYKETQMTHVRVGQPATVTIDAFPGVVLKGQVESWSPATGSQFSLLPPDNATGNFTKVVQRIPVKIVLEADSAVADRLRAGMSVIATIDTGAEKSHSQIPAAELP